MKRDVLHLLIKLNAIYIFCTFHLLGHVSILFLAAVRFCLLFFPESVCVRRVWHYSKLQWDEQTHSRQNSWIYYRTCLGCRQCL